MPGQLNRSSWLIRIQFMWNWIVYFVYSFPNSIKLTPPATPSFEYKADANKLQVLGQIVLLKSPSMTD